MIWRTNELRASSRTKGDVLGFVGIYGEAVLVQPGDDCVESGCAACGGSLVCGPGGKNVAIINIKG